MREVGEEDSRTGRCEDKEEEVEKFSNNHVVVTQGKFHRVVGQLRLEGTSVSL